MFDNDCAEFDPFEIDAFDPVVQAAADLLCPVVPDEAYTDVALGLPDVTSLDACALRVAALQDVVLRAQGEQLRLLAHMNGADESREHWVADLTACIFKMSIPVARTKLARSQVVAEQLPKTLELVESGEISTWYAETIASEAAGLPDEVRGEFDERVTRRASTQTMALLRQTIRRAKLRLDPRGGEERRKDALLNREVTTRVLDDGLASLTMTHSAEVIQAVHERITSATRLLPTSDPRTMAQQRADLIVDAVLSSLPADSLPTAQGLHPSVQVVVAAGTLLGADDEPGWLSGYGPITADHARELASDPTGTWRRILIDPDTSQVLDARSDKYKPSPHLIRLLAARDETCVFPPCNSLAHRCAVDHIVPFPEGKTTPRNTAMANGRHNEIKKIENGWSYVLNDDDSTTWTHLATGLTFTNHPPERWTKPGDHRPRPEDERADEAVEVETEPPPF